MVTNLISDVLVVGGGGAAARAALEASLAGAKVTLAVKGTSGRSVPGVPALRLPVFPRPGS